MKISTLCLVCLAVVSTRGNPLLGSRFPIGNDDDHECNDDCSQVPQRQVCGTDGRTYESRCHVAVAQCRGSNVEINHKGKCKESSSCEAERLNALSNDNPGIGVFIPECNDDGSYQQVQCYTGTGYCWCVTDQGKPVPGSSVRYQQPKCKGDGGKPNGRKNRSSKWRKGCSQSERQVFNTNLIQIFKDEYARLPTKPPASREDYRVEANLQGLPLVDGFRDSSERTVIDWKFSELDENSNGDLNNKELKSIKKMIKKIVEPRLCARNFAKHCDADADQVITKGEWAVCLGVDNNDKQTPQPGHHPRPPLERPESKSAEVDERNPSDEPGPSLSTRQTPKNTILPPKEVEQSCAHDREKALEEAVTSPDDGIFVPECREDGTFQPAQCHQAMQYCWCVLTDIGRPIPGTSTKNEMPKCDEDARSDRQRPVVSDREIKGCPLEKKESYLTDLLDRLTTEMVEQSQDGLDTEPDPEDTLEESTVKWKFRKLDKNNNDMIDKKEASKFRKEIKSLKPKKCTRNFVRYCDADGDKKISLTEWLDCFGLAEEEPRKPPRGTNPFI